MSIAQRSADYPPDGAVMACVLSPRFMVLVLDMIWASKVRKEPMWKLSGGSMKMGEGFVDAAFREFFEETFMRIRRKRNRTLVEYHTPLRLMASGIYRPTVVGIPLSDKELLRVARAARVISLQKGYPPLTERRWWGEEEDRNGRVHKIEVAIFERGKLPENVLSVHLPLIQTVEAWADEQFKK